MLQRLDAMESELSAMIESLRTGSNRLNADLQLLEGNLTEVSEAVAPRPRFEPEPEPVAAVFAQTETFEEEAAFDEDVARMQARACNSVRSAIECDGLR